HLRVHRVAGETPYPRHEYSPARPEWPDSRHASGSSNVRCPLRRPAPDVQRVPLQAAAVLSQCPIEAVRTPFLGERAHISRCSSVYMLASDATLCDRTVIRQGQDLEEHRGSRTYIK